MCGIAGFLRAPGVPSDALRHDAQRMAGVLQHRGPDDGDTWVDADAGVALAHRRLSILELSPEGRQPMVSEDGRHVLVFNGEIYNHAELRGRLQAAGATLRGRSDTRVLVEGIARWGVEETLARCTGMFALAAWDRSARVLTLARDRMGEKPLYYGRAGDVFLFGSELKALRAHPEWRRHGGGIDRAMLAEYLRHNYLPGARSIHPGIFRLEPGCLVRLGPDARGAVAKQAYWSLAEIALRGEERPFRGSRAEADAEFARLLETSVVRQMEADVSLGAFLSGGIDSSAVTALMQAQARTRGAPPVRTFSIGFDDPALDEAAHARAVAIHLGTDHTELRVTGADALAVVPRLPEIYDEPFGDSSAIPTVLLSALTRKHVIVALSGDGADELLAGYPRYALAARLRRMLERTPAPARKSAGGLLRALAALAGTPEVRRRYRNLGSFLAGATPAEAYPYSSLFLWKDPGEILAGPEREREALLRNPAAWPALRDPLRLMLHLDQRVYLPDDLLVKVDRAAMAASLETRAPLLDHALVEFCARLPTDMLARNGRSKAPLRALLERHVPRHLIDRPKMGFAVPLAAWLRGPLREWAGDLLAEDRVRREGYFDARRLQAAWGRFLDGRWNGEQHLWCVLMFQAWNERDQRHAQRAGGNG